jgi:TPR repeat protein
MLYEEACEDKYGEACARLAVMYEKGFGVERDVKRAAGLRKDACKAGYLQACDKPKAQS